MKDRDGNEIKVGDTVYVCNTELHYNQNWTKIIVSHVNKGSIRGNLETEKMYGGPWTVSRYIKKRLTKLEKAIK